MPNKLKPCPFCGGEPITRVRTVEQYESISTIELTVRCKCGIKKKSIVELCDTDFSTLINVMQTLTDEWNRRANNG